MESYLYSQLENGRAFRLMTKLGFINERPEFARDARWSETGDRYIVKLFRDYVFHQVDEHGHPVVNLSHVLTCLNKVGLQLLAYTSYERLMSVSSMPAWTSTSCSCRETSKVIWKINKRLSAIASGVGHYRRLPVSPIVLRKANELQVAGVSWRNAAGLELVRIS